MRIVMLTGMSGSGKSTAFKFLEDMGFDCVDNLPVPLIKGFIDLAAANMEADSKIAIGVDIRNGKQLSNMEEVLDELEEDGRKIEILFLDAEDEVLIKRYKETRRMHPLSGSERIQSGIIKEREALTFLRAHADYIIDTSHLLTRELKSEMEKILVRDPGYKSMFVTILSFGFKYGIPTDADLVFDVRFLPNPYYDVALRPMTGNDKVIQEFVMNAPESHEFMDKLTDMIRFLIDNYIKEGKNQLVICIGCTGGKHRSVTVANALYHALEGAAEYGLKIEHRDIEKDRARGK